MSIFSRRKRLLNRTPKAPKMSSRRQFHRALRRHPAWPMVMAEAAARARANQATSGLSGSIASGNKWLRNTWLRRLAMPMESSVKSLWPDTAAAAWRRSKLKRNIRRNRVLLVTLLSVGGVFALLTGISLAQGEWYPRVLLWENSQPPPARFGAATAFDEVSEEVVIFGGFVGNTSASNVGSVAGPPISNDDKTWAYKIATGAWINRNPIKAPSARGFASMAYDGARKNVVLFGGALYRNNASVFGDTWTWDGQNWTLQNPPKPVPDPRQNAAMAYDAHRKVVVMFGGRDANGKPMNDTWIWDGSAWKIMPSAGAPSPRHSAAMAYDVCRAEAVMFGGQGIPNAQSFDPAPGETWIWTGDCENTRCTAEDASWAPALVDGKTPLLSPTPSRIGASMAYSTSSGRVALFGGFSTTETGQSLVASDSDVWRWDGASLTGWEKMNSEITTAATEVCFLLTLACDFTPRAQPPARGYASFAYDPRSEFTLFGGSPSADLNPAPQAAFGDHFAFSEKGILAGANPDQGCVNPVPKPPDDPTDEAVSSRAPKTEVRQGVEEIDQLPVLIGTDWPGKNRNTHLNYNGGPINPNSTPAPDCPNRRKDAGSYSDENGSNTHLVTDPTRNRIYQFFVCDPTRGQGYNTPTQYGNKPEVFNLLIEAYDGTTLKPIGKSLARNVKPQTGYGFEASLIHDPGRGRFLLRSARSDNLWELTKISQDRIEQGLDPVIGTYVQGPAGAPPMQSGGASIAKNVFNHPTTGLPKLFSDAWGGGPTAGSTTVTPGPPPTVTPGSPPAASTPPKLGQWDLETMTKDWEVPVAGGCTNILGGVAMRSGNRVYTTCHVGNGQWAVVRVTITENADGTETPSTTVEVFPAPYETGGNFPLFWGDPQTERMIVAVGVYSKATVWTFDGKVSRWVGRTGIGGSNLIKWGFDPQSGRLYLHMGDTTFGNTRGGVRLIDTRLTPVPQPLDFPQFASMTAATPVYLPATAGSPRKIFIRNTSGKMKKYPNWETIEFENEMFYRILTDNIPLPEPADLSDLDSLTIGVPETPGKTEVGFDAEGSAYGIRLRSIGGVWSAARPFQQIAANDNYRTGEGFVMPPVRHLIPYCVFPDRELMAGWVPQAHLSDLDALAISSGLEVDSNSKSDLLAPTSRCNPTANASNFPPSSKGVFDVLWPLKNLLEYEANKAASTGAVAFTSPTSDPTGTTPTNTATTPVGTLYLGKEQGVTPTVGFTATTSSSWDRHFKEVVCVGDALKTYQAAVGNIYGSSDCVQSKGLVKATARGSASGSGPLAEEASKQGFSVAEGYSTVTVAREPVRGVVVTATAVAKGIQLPGLTIGSVTTTAVAWSNGRPGEKRASFSRGICRVISTNFDHEKECLTDGSNGTVNEQQNFVNMWNSGGGKNSQMYLPTPDPDYYQGSPGGYIAGVIKPLANTVEDELFAKDSLKEVSGLEVHFYKDSPTEGDARQTLQLAAVRAIAGLGVQCNPDLVYSPQSKGCIDLTFEDDLLTEEFEEEEEFDDSDLDSYEEDGGWISVEALGPFEPLALGKKIGRFIQNLPILRRLPIRQMGEALMAASVWMLLGMPLFLASRRFALNLARRS